MSRIAETAAIGAAAGGATLVAAPLALTAAGFGARGIAAGSAVAAAQSLGASGALVGALGPLGLAGAALGGLVAGIVGIVQNTEDRMGEPSGLRKDWNFAVVAERGVDNVMAFPHSCYDHAVDRARVGGWTRRFVVELDWVNKTWTESAHQGACPWADDRMRAWLREHM
jgi:hypothetical protein